MQHPVSDEKIRGLELLAYPYPGKYATRDQWELCYCYSKSVMAGLIIWDSRTRLFIFKLHPMFGHHLGLSKPYSKVRFRNLNSLKSFIVGLGVDELKSIIV